MFQDVSEGRSRFSFPLRVGEFHCTLLSSPDPLNLASIALHFLVRLRVLACPPPRGVLVVHHGSSFLEVDS